MASIRKRGNSWQARVKRLGTEVEQSFKSKQAAERWARQVEFKIELGEYLPPSNKSSDTPLSFGEILQRYNDSVASSHRSSTTKTNIRTLIKDLGHLSVEQIEPKTIALWRDSKLSLIKAASVNRLIGTLGAVINHARKEWQIPIDNPIHNIRRPASGAARTRRLVGDEEQRLLKELPSKYRRVAKFAIATAMRRSEILGLEWDKIDTDLRIARLFQTKNGCSRTVPLSNTAIEVLDEIAHESCHHFEGRVFDINPIAMDKAWRRACSKAEIHDLRFHDLRREAVSRFFEMDLNIAQVSLISGHKTLSQLQVYTRLDALKLAKRLSTQN